jgi:hypothetical protein
MRQEKIATIQFNKKTWSEAKAEKWLKDHSYKSGKLDIGPRFYHFRQHKPESLREQGYKVFRTLKIAPGLELVIAIHEISARRYAKEHGEHINNVYIVDVQAHPTSCVRN